MFVRLPVQLDDPVEILRTINAETKEAKVMQSAIGADTLQDFAQFIPPARLQPGHAAVLGSEPRRPPPAGAQPDRLERARARRSRSTRPAPR